MNVDELDVSQDIIDALKAQGYVELHPPQAKALPLALEGKNLVVAVPTASGKSLIGYVSALKTILERQRKVLYIVPLKALATEKKDDFDRFSPLGFKTALSIGDLDSEDKWLSSADVIIATSEKADSLLRHGSPLVNDIGLVIADEIHLIHDPSRGPTLEVALTKLKRKNHDMQIIALSATISNANDLAAWLDAELVRMDWRPIKLHEGVYLDWNITFDDGSYKPLEKSGDEIWSLVADTVADGGQCIIFVNARRSTESLAVKYSGKMKAIAGRMLTEEEKSIIEGDVDATALGRKLSACVACGMAFHNAGLTYKQRRYVEDNFKQGNIKCIVATPTLAAGINLPARRVIVRDTKRFEANAGSVPISVMEIKQMCGRAGRPGFDPYGEAILMAKSFDDFQNLMDNYIRCDSETIMSKLGNETVLRSHILGLIATDDANTVEEIIEFIRETFYGSESQLFGIETAVENVVDFLVEEEMAERDGERINILPFGKRVSDLYIDPKSAVILKNAVRRMTGTTAEVPILHAVASTPDVLGMYPRKADQDMLALAEEKYANQFLAFDPDEEDYYHEYFLGDLKTALLMEAWINETSEDRMTSDFGVGPGDVRSRVDQTDWILYAMSEVAVLFNPGVVKQLRQLLVRVRYGIKKDVLDLITFRGVGRARARILCDNGIRSREDVAATPLEKLAAIPKIGNALAKSMKDEVGEAPKEFVLTSVDEDVVISDKPKKQSTLF